MDYSERSDLAIGNDDIKYEDNKITVTVHNLGAINSKPTTIALVNTEGKNVSENSIPEIEAPKDLNPKTVEVVLNVPEGINLNSLSIQIDPQKKLTEITRGNNTLKLKTN